MLKEEPKISKFAPSSYNYKKEKPTFKVIISGIIILLVAGMLAHYAQQGVDFNKSEPSILGFIVMLVVGITSAIVLERCARYLIDR